MKKILTGAFIIATIAMSAQNGKMKKACIKIDSNDNGKIKKIDTCVTAATDEELQQKINALGLGEMAGLPSLPPAPPTPPGAPGIPQISIQMDSLPGGGKEVMVTKMIVIDDGENDGNAKKASTQTKIISSASGQNAEVIVMDGEGNITHTSAGPDGTCEVKKLKPGEKLDPEVEKMLKENGPEEVSGNRIVIKNKDGKENNTVKVFVFSKTEVKNLSESDKKQLPADAARAIEKSMPFDELRIAPNPTEDACTISYRPKSKEPLQIKVYNGNGKTVYAETDSEIKEQISKAISLRDLGKGTYFVHLTQGKQSEVRKVIVK